MRRTSDRSASPNSASHALNLGAARLKKRRWLWPLLGAVSVIAGLQGVRMLMLLGAPLFLACLAEAFGALRRSETLREAARSEEARYLAGACVVLAGMCAGRWMGVLHSCAARFGNWLQQIS